MICGFSCSFTEFYNNVRAQVANPEDVNEFDNSSKITRRSRISSLGKKVLDKVHHKRPDDIDA